MTLARSSIHFWAASRNGCKYGTVLLRNVIEKRGQYIVRVTSSRTASKAAAARCGSGFTNHFGPSAFLPVISLRFIAAHTHTTEDSLAPFHATGTSRCVYQGSGPLARSACSDTYGSSS